ncbi:hypothetical protein LIA77_05452 [Sarocladium implicatum]|nr:hypothetical protein LIA77_05452 [Sarocladium implicatum]
MVLTPVLHWKQEAWCSCSQRERKKSAPKKDVDLETATFEHAQRQEGICADDHADVRQPMPHAILSRVKNVGGRGARSRVLVGRQCVSKVDVLHDALAVSLLEREDFLVHDAFVRAHAMNHGSKSRSSLSIESTHGYMYELHQCCNICELHDSEENVCVQASHSHVDGMMRICVTIK